MPAKSNTYANQLLQLLFNAVDIPGVADNTVTAPLTELVFALHTADPGDGGTQASFEAAYLNYLRVLKPRTVVGFTVGVTSVTLASAVNFPAAGVGTIIETLTHFSVGDGGRIFYRGVLSPEVVIADGVPPILSSGTTITEQ